MTYAFLDKTNGLSTDGLFRLTDQSLRSVQINLPWERDIDPTAFYISQVDNLANQLKLYIGYKKDSDPILVATAVCAAEDGLLDSVVSLVPAVGWEDIVGSVVVGNYPAGPSAPIGSFSFEIEQTRLPVSSIRPAARSMSAIVVTDGTQQSQTLTGLVELQAGENIRLRVDYSEGYPRIIIDAIDTSEFLQECGCEDTVAPPIRRIGSVEADSNGNINLIGSQCLELTSAEHTVSLNNPCSQPCCGCETAEVLTSNLKPLSSRIDQTQQNSQRILRDLDYLRRVSSLIR